jgi:hypothetical protein
MRNNENLKAVHRGAHIHQQRSPAKIRNAWFGNIDEEPLSLSMSQSTFIVNREKKDFD